MTSKSLEQPIKPFSTEVATWEGMIADISNAQRSVVFEQFLFLSYKPGQIGHKFAEAFIKASQRGVKVRLHIDAFGSSELLFHRKFIKKFKEAGIELTFYRTSPLSRLKTPFRLFIRNHRKVLLIDEKISWIGGVIMGEEYRRWLDYTWRIDSIKFGMALSDELKNQVERLDTGKRIIAPFKKVTEKIRLVGNSPGIGNRHVYEQICEHILLSEFKIVMITPYFVPPYRLLKVLELKLADGADIELLVPKATDHVMADWARWIYLKKLQKKGLKIRMCKQMNHAKIVFTNDWATFGSTNLDYLSLVFNHELNLDTYDQDLINLINNQYNAWINDCHYEACDEELIAKIKPNILQRTIGRLLRFIM